MLFEYFWLGLFPTLPFKFFLYVLQSFLQIGWELWLVSLILFSSSYLFCKSFVDEESDTAETDGFKISNKTMVHSASVNISEDRLGYALFAKKIARALERPDKGDGFVVGIEGGWGIGKTTLINYVKLSFKSETKHISFSPWLISDRDKLIYSLLMELEYKIQEDKLLPYKDIQSLRDYSRRFSERVGPIVKLMDTLKALPFSMVSFDAFTSLLKSDQKPLEDLKSDVVSGLQKLPNHFIIFIDDLDRLEPSEVVEVLRMVRAAVEFPNITYVFSYDEDNVAKAVSNHFQIDNGYDYLGKIINAKFVVPKPEQDDLLTWFFDECYSLYEQVLGLTNLRIIRTDLLAIRNLVNLETPRQVLTLINSIKMRWPSVAENVSFRDFIWLEAIKYDNPVLYKAIEYYVTSYFRIQDTKHKRIWMDRLKDQVQKAFDPERRTDDYSNAALSMLLPGSSGGSTLQLFENESETKIVENRQFKRLASVNYYKYFFLHDAGIGHLSDREFSDALNALETREGAIEVLRFLGDEVRSNGSTKLDSFLYRIQNEDINLISKDVACNMIIGLADYMDEYLLKDGNEHWGRILIWSVATVILSRFIKLVQGIERGNLLIDICNNLKAKSWFTIDFLWNEMIAHGETEHASKPEDQWLLNSEELNSLKCYLIDNVYENMSESIADVPQFFDYIYTWWEIHHPSLKKWWNMVSVSDEKVLEILLRLRNLSTAEIRPLDIDQVRAYFDIHVGHLLIGISDRNPGNQEIHRKINILDAAIEAGNNRVYKKK
ncbi:hypothetical protein KFE96_06285 [Kordiimonas sp. SCSIO 12603]|uniref:KAP family P-loop NTPase fold protein n=1 Tax=Kordiimonas sp. SCSIO 12603 TaxID=2829596 RepID=UPI002104C73A|nr:P-loop NTPase fold protein [Kordiimonas sp. SCSIO 12603]UTW59907.1 hypothetical protein KFE96_06285 [Kordiimonas sp. SCSIO 12603]